MRGRSGARGLGNKSWASRLALSRLSGSRAQTWSCRGGRPRSFRRAFSAALFASLPTDGLNGFIIARSPDKAKANLARAFSNDRRFRRAGSSIAFFWSASFFLRNLSAFSAFWAAASASAFSGLLQGPFLLLPSFIPFSQSPWLPNERPAPLFSALSSPSCPPRP